MQLNLTNTLIMTNKPSALSDYPIVHTQAVVWGDMDSMNHVNNTKYFYYCETARIEFIRLLFPNFGAEPSSGMTSGLALAETGCRFKVSVSYPDSLHIGTAVSQIGTNEFWVEHAIFSEKMNLIAAQARARLVHYDFKKSQRLTFDDDLMAILKKHQLSQDI